MKFQKTLLAAALSVVGLSAQAANVEVNANLAKYELGNDFVYLVEDVNNANPFLEIGKFYTKDANGVLTEKTGVTLAKEQEVISKGQVQFSYNDAITNVVPGTSTTTPELKDNVGQNNYWYSSDTTATTTDLVTSTGEVITVMGKLVNPDDNGNTTAYEEVQFGTVIVPSSTTGGVTTTTQVKKDIQIGNLTQVADGSNTEDAGGTRLATYEFELAENKAQGTLATIQTEAGGNTAVAGLTGNGLAVLDVAKGGTVDLEKGTVTFTQYEEPSVNRKGLDTTGYKVGDDLVVKIESNYYIVDAAASTLTKYTGDIKELESKFADSKGLTDELTTSKVTTSVNTGLVSNKNVTYGESVTVAETTGGLKVSITDPRTADEISGQTFSTDAQATKTTTTSKNVVTGIIAQDEAGNKTYGLEATTVVDNKVTAQTTVTAEGIKTTGDIAFVDAEGKTTSVKGYLAETSKAVDAKIDAGLQQFNKTASRLNSRIDDVEKTSYRGIAIALAAQQQIPNIGAGQTAVFGGVGHYEGESAAALGLATVLADGRTSLSAALGVAGGSEVGGRVGVAYVFGGK